MTAPEIVYGMDGKPMVWTGSRWEPVSEARAGVVESISARSSWTAEELLAADFPEPRFAVPGIITEGLNLFVGAPKLGKSWLALNLAIAVASGGRALGIVPVDRGEVLYLALEDGPRRLKKRLEMVLGAEPAPEGLHFETEWQALADGGAKDLGTWLAMHPGTRLVVVDVIARLRSPVKNNSDRYLFDYMIGEEIKRVADHHGCAVIAVHHTRKAAADDFVDSVSGTNGLAGAADTIIVLKRSRGQADATFHVTGRDVEEQELALNFDPHIGTWALLGDAQEWRLSETRRQMIEAIREAGPSQPKAIADALDLPRDLVRQTVTRMAKDGQLVNSAGTYSLPPEPLSQVSQVSQQVIPPTGEVTGVTGVTPIPDVESERGERLSSQPLTHPSETKDLTPLTRENAPENGLSSHISESKDEGTKPPVPTAAAATFGAFALCSRCGERHCYGYVEGQPVCPKCIAGVA